MKRGLAALAVAVVLAVAVYVLFIRDTSSSTAPPAAAPQAVAQIGEGSGAIVISDQGTVLSSPSTSKQTGKEKEKGKARELPQLPLKKVPKGGRVKGPVLEQVHVLAAAPKALSPYLAATGYRKDEGGVEVETTDGIELRFGDDSKAGKKWEAATAILADPSITTLSYVDLQAPAKPSYGGEGHELPPAP